MRMSLVPLLLTTVALGADWPRVEKPRTFSFPRDHGSHPEFKTEWWYFTGNLKTADGRAFGYQLTWFRSGLTPTPAPRASKWAARDVFAAHAAITDIQGERFLHAERLARGGAAGLAGASTETFDVHLRDWTGSRDADGRFRIKADAGDFAIDLVCRAEKAPVLQGVGGVSRKGPQPGQASYYISLTRMVTRGTLRVGSATFEVAGESWMDQEFGSNQLAESQIGWDWYGLVLDDGRELMLYSLRSKDGSSHRRATIIEPDGSPTYFEGGAITLETLDTWASSESGGKYPTHRRIKVGDRLDIEVRPRLAAQEMRTAGSTGITYYEGASAVTGRLDGKPVRGLGYTELTGYAGSVGRL